MGAAQTFVKKIIIKDDYVKKDGTCPLYIYVSIDGKWDRINLKLSWPPAYFDKEGGRILARGKDDTDFSDYQLMIDTELGKVNEILKEYRLSSRVLTIEQLISDYNSYTSRKDFLSFWLTDVNERAKRKKIEDGSRKGYLATLNSLTDFWRHEQKKPLDPNLPLYLPFSALTPKMLENWRAWMKSERSNVPSTVENHMKNLRVSVKRALAQGNVFSDPFKVVKVSKPETYPNALTEEQLRSMIDLFNDSQTPDGWQTVLRHFLFSCFTGLRISDAKAIKHENIKDGWIVIMPQKTLRYHKTVKIPLHPMAKQLITTSLGRLFDTFSEPYTNRVLKDIAAHLGIYFKVSTHTARHTFGTIFIELGGDVVTLKSYMGHSNISTTMKYVHLSEARKKEKINVFDKLFNKNDTQKGAA